MQWSLLYTLYSTPKGVKRADICCEEPEISAVNTYDHYIHVNVPENCIVELLVQNDSL